MAMVKVEVVVHPQGLAPIEAAKAWHMRVVEKMKRTDIQKKVKNVKGKIPQSEHCVKNAVQRVTAAGKKGVAKTNYKNCGRKKALTPEETKQVVGFVKRVEEKNFLHMSLHQGRAEIESELGHHCSNSQQQWLLLESSAQEKPPHRCTATEKERVCRHVWGQKLRMVVWQHGFSF